MKTKNYFLTLALAFCVQLISAQSYDYSLELLPDTNNGNVLIGLVATPNFDEADGNSGGMGALVSLSNNIFIGSFVNDCTTTPPPNPQTVCDYPMEKEEWEAIFLDQPSINSGNRFVYQLARTESGEATFLDAEDGTPIILCAFEIVRVTGTGAPDTGDITFVEDNDPIMTGTPGVNFFNISFPITTGSMTTDLFNQFDPSASTVNFGTLSTDSEDFAQVSIFPNPTTGIVNINGINNLEHVEVYNINGQLVRRFNEGLQQIDISDVQAGVYFLNVTTATAAKRIKIVKK